MTTVQCGAAVTHQVSMLFLLLTPFSDVRGETVELAAVDFVAAGFPESATAAAAAAAAAMSFTCQKNRLSV